MGKVYAHRDLKICSKDCLCLFVCPTGATNNETGQIDKDKCIGCGACALACPAHAITLIPRKMPPAQPKTEEVIVSLDKVIRNKIREIWQIHFLLEKSENEAEKNLLKALYHSHKVVLEDLMREKGYMLPESKNTHEFLQTLLTDEFADPKIVQKLLELLELNE